MTGPRRRREGSSWGVAGEVSSLATTFAFAVLIGVFGGKWLGAKLGHEDVGLLVGLILGTTAAFLELARVVRRFGARRAAEHPQHDEGRDNGSTGEG